MPPTASAARGSEDGQVSLSLPHRTPSPTTTASARGSPTSDAPAPLCGLAVLPPRTVGLVRASAAAYGRLVGVSGRPRQGRPSWRVWMLKENIRVGGKHDIPTKVMTTTLFAQFAEVERDLISERAHPVAVALHGLGMEAGPQFQVRPRAASAPPAEPAFGAGRPSPAAGADGTTVRASQPLNLARREQGERTGAGGRRRGRGGEGHDHRGRLLRAWSRSVRPVGAGTLGRSPTR